MSGNNVYLIWDNNSGYANVQTPLSDIYYMKSSDNGQTWNNKVRLTYTNDSNHPAIAAYRDNLHIAWREVNPNALNYMISRDNGDTWSSITTLSSSLNVFVYLAMDAADNFNHIVWFGEAPDVGNFTWRDPYSIFYKRVIVEPLPAPTPKIITVDDSGGANYTRIQDAIDNASARDTILVYSGTYYENVDVNRQLVLRGVDTGGGMPVVDANGRGSAITLSAGNSTLEGFDVINAIVTNKPNAGIKINSNNNIIEDNKVSNSYHGIWLNYSNNNTIVRNNASNNDHGIYLSSSNNNTLNGNNASSNNYNGILLSSSSNDTLSSNNASLNNQHGIYLHYSSSNILDGNNVESNNYYGIFLDYSSYNTLNGNNASNNSNGIDLYSSSNNSLHGNIANSNHGYGIYLFSTSNNFLYQNNIVNNTNNAYDTGTNHWDNGAIGNHHSNYDEPVEGCFDANNNSICDSGYNIPGGTSVDRYPLAFGAHVYNLPPVADFIYSPSNLAANQTITFDASLSYDPDGNITGYWWNISGNVFTAKIVNLSFPMPGIYYAGLIVTDNSGATNSTSKWINVTYSQPLPDFQLSGNASVLWNTTIYDGLSSAHSSRDFDLDGAPDIIAYSRDISRMHLLSGKNGKNVWERFLGSGIGRAWDYGVNDLDGDNGSDLAVIAQNNFNYYQDLIILKGKTGNILWNKSIGSGYWNQIMDIGDISGDGKNDMLLVYSYYTWDGYYNYYTTRLIAVRGFDGFELWNREYVSRDWLGVYPQTSGDLDRDGKEDLLVKIYSSTSPGIEALNASGGSLIWRKSGDYYAIPAGDISGDGYADVFISARNGTGAARGYNASLLWLVPGKLIGSIDDVNGDNRTDAITETENLLGEKQINVLSGSNGSLLWRSDLWVQSPWVSVLPMKDLDGDRKADMVAITNNFIFAISGGNGSIMWTLTRPNLLDSWAWAQYAGDLTGDGRGDVAVYLDYRKSIYDYTYYRSVTALAGYAGARLWEVNEIPASQESPLFIGDFDGDVKGDVLLTGNYSGVFGSTSDPKIQILASAQERQTILSSDKDAWIKQRIMEEMRGREGFGAGSAQVQAEPTAAGSYQARAFTGDSMNTTIWRVDSSKSLHAVWPVYCAPCQEPGIDYDGDGLFDAALIVDNTIYMLVRV